MGQDFRRLNGTALHELDQPRNIFTRVAVPLGKEGA